MVVPSLLLISCYSHSCLSLLQPHQLLEGRVWDSTSNLAWCSALQGIQKSGDWTCCQMESVPHVLIGGPQWSGSGLPVTCSQAHERLYQGSSTVGPMSLETAQKECVMGTILVELCDLLSQPSLNLRVNGPTLLGLSHIPGAIFSSNTGILILSLERKGHQRIRVWVA